MAETHDPVIPLLLEAIETRRARRARYGASEVMFAKVMTALFPDGITLVTMNDQLRHGILTQVVSKLCRYVNDPEQGHIDSAHDLGVYAFMLEAEDRRIQK